MKCGHSSVTGDIKCGDSSDAIKNGQALDITVVT
jgi:hypothetical protein